MSHVGWLVLFIMRQWDIFAWPMCRRRHNVTSFWRLNVNEVHQNSVFDRIVRNLFEVGTSRHFRGHPHEVFRRYWYIWSGEAKKKNKQFKISFVRWAWRLLFYPNKWRRVTFTNRKVRWSSLKINNIQFPQTDIIMDNRLIRRDTYVAQTRRAITTRAKSLHPLLGWK